MGKRHYPLESHHIKRLISHFAEGGILESHKDVPEAVRDELYEEQKLEKSKRKGGQAVGTGVQYPPININVLLSQSTAHEIDLSAHKALGEWQALSPLNIPGPRDLAVDEYVYNVMLENGLDLEQVYKDQDPKFFIEKGVKIGIARHFVEDIGKWVKNVKKAVSVCETL
ncbi:hypothetical protein N7491_001719 [Penicillium cf. griseofulvum]|uniref:Uncharacterized protein n=1 Tax=Penicillium cf. griseofulvum TaxID=2972120 RepID=A0A9W9M945_9EURO|nr:hypothetical protein N7472_006847 [Penicillium cf. griseofulvum]KAJ5445637.1 hypothetical protein N7491_001719 [Penicillium cf. griseofulvum]